VIRAERLDKMVHYINKKKYTSIYELGTFFNISKATVHRDLEFLARDGLICLTRGGARYLPKYDGELPYNEKRCFQREEKVRICRAAAGRIGDSCAVFLDTGTTTRELVPFLMERHNLRVVTNDVIIAAELAANNAIDTTVTGGDIRKGFYTLSGFLTENFLAHLHVDIAFLTLDAIHPDHGGMITDMEEVGIKKNIIHCADQVFALCDHSKFEKTAFYKCCELNDINLFITGKELNGKTKMTLEEAGIQLEFV
jgi:DeoR/GlpR family transcriptional regulator of sugar metabolism